MYALRISDFHHVFFYTEDSNFGYSYVSRYGYMDESTEEKALNIDDERELTEGSKEATSLIM